MPRPDPRTRILCLGASATAVVAALALAINPPSDIDPLGSLGRADAASPAAVADGPPAAFGVEGIDLAAFGYSGPDLDATTVEQLSGPMPKLPTQQAAAARDRLAVAQPHLEGLHQAKNLLRKAAAKQDHHLYAAKVAAAEAEAARREAEQRLADAIQAARPTPPPAEPVPAEGGPDEPAADVQSAALAADVHEVDASVDGDQPDAAVDEAEGRGTRQPEAKGTPDGKGKPEGRGKPQAQPGAADRDASPRPDGVPERQTGDEEAKADVEAERPVAAPAVPTAEDVVRTGREVERLAAEAAKARAAAAAQWQELEERRERRRIILAAAEAAQAELGRFDSHVRWLGAVLDKAEGRMLSVGGLLVEQSRGAGELPIVEVRGFEVHEAIADSVRQLVDAAAQAGIDLEGRAYRPISRQIELRRQNCGSSDYDVYEKPSSLCSPPTAKPGRSLHELGLALDLRNGENPITSRRDPAFRWLAANAPAYGLYNLPAEPWHWSVTSQ